MFTFDDFNFIKLIGAGTFGKVYLVQYKRENMNKNKYYALKTLWYDKIIHLRQISHAYNEKELLWECKGHPFIVDLAHTFTTDGYLCLLMEYINGGELFFWLRKKRKWCLKTIRFYSAQIILALEFLHNKNVIYRDLKPENILVTHDGYIKLTDFGFAKKIENITFTVCGTPEYMAPEELDGEGHGKEVDFWSLGILMYEMALGIPPFYDSESNDIIYQKICNSEPKFPNNIDPILKDLLQKLLVKERRYRLGSLRGVQEIKEHKFFQNYDWDSLLEKKLHPFFKPPVKSHGDTSNFIEYSMEELDDRIDVPKLFTHFRFDT